MAPKRKRKLPPEFLANQEKMKAGKLGPKKKRSKTAKSSKGRKK